jgi:hypothetical protein
MFNTPYFFVCFCRGYAGGAITDDGRTRIREEIFCRKKS